MCTFGQAAGVRSYIDWCNSNGVTAVVESMDPDAELVRRTLRGELSAYGELVARHRDVVHRVVARIAGPQDADDLTQDAFLRAFHKLASFRGDAPFRAWLLRVAHNTALNALGRRRPEPMAEVPEPEVQQPGPADALEARERRQRLERKLLGLTPSHRTVLVLRDLEGLSYEEIAEITETPLGSVKARLHRARNELAEMLRNNTYDWGIPS
jgi:RNA polymerase sigma-70 factor, ECF subfamily